jgi:hypothetical protein
MTVNISIFRHVTSCTLVDRNKHYGVTRCLIAQSTQRCFLDDSNFKPYYSRQQKDITFESRREIPGYSLFAFDLLQYGTNLTTIKALVDWAKHRKPVAGPTLTAPGTSQGLHAAPDRRMTSHQAGKGEGQGGVGNGASIIVARVQTATRARKGRHRPVNKMLYVLVLLSMVITAS